MSAAPPLDFRNVNSLWAGVLVETLVRCGVRCAAVSPGSRSTPLTLALARQPRIEAIPVLDERSAAFFALGHAKRTRAPVALVCTSGTAAANYLPAIVEAHETGVPLVVITADRPPELRACASGQTIDQQKIYGGAVSFYHELALPEASESALRYLRQTIAHAVQATLWPRAGAVHLNAPFRDPLPPIDDGGVAQNAVRGIDWEKFFAQLQPVSPEAWETVSRLPRLTPEVHGLIVAGPQNSLPAENFAALVAEIATKLGWPVATDGLSPLRNFGARVPHLVTTADTILREAGAAERLAPEVVLCLGGWPTSKVLRGWIEASDARIFLCSAHPANRDALHGRTQHFAGLAALAQLAPIATEPNGYQRLWASFERKARAALDTRLGAMTELFEGRAAWLLGQHLPADTPLFVANSMPVRDVEYFWPPNDRRAQPFVNRGANGIDGTLSSALGVAHGAERPAVLLTGDLALLHDANGFLARPKMRGSLTIVLVNNRGGGIFEHLPVAQFDPPFEEFFATPQEVDFARLCAAHGVEHVPVRDWAHFTTLISTLPAAGIRVLELRTDRKRDAATRKRFFAEVAASLA
ncbi:MAG TPA: 2-succinyl-5-enolpyruvyl-6-hydroxy-3-cyclohexene-1-carboxylic-acid synthase [Opitutaceae bacterium]|nr:2-succinyl-5-enolpyruvyl-6-hydroxy-3-cyclohexene-1-carboxylic-acid synthase [Opitutaceae bacterium]